MVAQKNAFLLVAKVLKRIVNKTVNPIFRDPGLCLGILITQHLTTATFGNLIGQRNRLFPTRLSTCHFLFCHHYSQSEKQIVADRMLPL